MNKTFFGMAALTAAFLVGCSPSQPAATVSPIAGAPSPMSISPSASPSATTPTELDPTSAKMDHIRVETVQMALMPSAEVTSPGKVEANPSSITHVYLPVAGKVSRVLVHIGDHVSLGQSLATVISADATEAQTALRTSEAAIRNAQDTAIEANVALSKARTSLRKAEIDYQRVKDLFQHDAIAQKEVLVAETDLKQAKSDLQNALAVVDQSKAGIESANAGRDHATSKLDILGVQARDPRPEINVPSPLAGKVLEMSVVAGEYHSDLGSSIMTIVDLSSVWVTSNVPENQIRFISLGEPVSISLDAYPGEVFNGRVARVADVLDPKTRTIKVMTELSNPLGRLRPEMFGRMHHTHKASRLPVVPPTAVLQKGEGREVVYVQTHPGSFEPREVEVGQRQGERVAITRGLSQGEKIVVDGAMLLKK